MKKIIITCFLLLITSFLFAQKVTILVYPFENDGTNEYSWVSAGMTNTVVSDLESLKGISVITEEERNKALKELEFILSDLSTDKKAVKTGQLTGADLIFSGNYTVYNEKIRVIAKLIKVESGAIENTIKLDGLLENLFDVQDEIVISLMDEAKKVKINQKDNIIFTQDDKENIKEKIKPDLTAYEYYAKGLEIINTNPQQALVDFEKAIELESDYVDALKRAGWTAGVKLSQFSKALKYLQRAEQILLARKEVNTSKYARIITNIGSVYYLKGEVDKALEYYFKAYEILEKFKLENTFEFVAVLNDIGIVYKAKGHLDKALEYYFKACEIEEKLGSENNYEYSTIMMNIGIVYYIRGEFDKALEYYYEAYAIQEELGLENASGFAGLLKNIGIVYKEKGEFDKALEFYFRAYEIQEKLGLENTSGFATLLNEIGVVYDMRGESDKALEYYFKAYEIQKKLELENTSRFAGLLNNIGIIYKAKGEFDRALEYYFKAYEIQEKLGLENTYLSAIIIANIGIVYEARGELDKAGKQYRKAYEILEIIGYTGEEKYEYKEIAEDLGY